MHCTIAETFKVENFSELKKNTIFVEKTRIVAFTAPRMLRPQILQKKPLCTEKQAHASKNINPLALMTKLAELCGLLICISMV